MTRAQITAMQDRIGTTPDGFWGPKSITACQRHLRALMPKDANWPGTSQAALQGFYGSPQSIRRRADPVLHCGDLSAGHGLPL